MLVPSRLGDVQRTALGSARDTARGSLLTSLSHDNPRPVSLMNVVSVTDDELRNAATEGQKIASTLNRMLAQRDLARLTTTGRIAFIYHPYIIDGNLGQAYKEGYMKWAPGALTQLCRMFESENPPKFGAGSFGSVWFDVDLTSEGKTKKVRVAYHGKQGATYLIMLDATFDETW